MHTRELKRIVPNRVRIPQYACPICEDIYDEYSDALDCCQHRVWICGVCETAYITEGGAEHCCEIT